MITSKLKRGQKHHDLNLVFWRYMKTASNGEYWVTPEEFQRLLEKTKESSNAWNEANKQRVKELAAAFQFRNPGYAARSKQKQRKIRGKELLEYEKKWRKNNPEKIKAIRKKMLPKQREWARNKRKSDPIFAMKNRVRVRINRYIKNMGATKSQKTIEILGCQWVELKHHLEKQFKDGMSWLNRNQWHIDHIIPLASAKTELELIKLSHYTNLQPLWAFDNMKKGAKMPTVFDESEDV